MNILSLLKLLGGLGLFLYGMLTMGNALEKMAGEKLEKTLETVTGNIFKAVGVGALVTGIIQSSSATTVMVVGFVNAGIMNLKQAVGVIMGANIGTTVTAQLLRLDSSGAVEGSLLMQILKPSMLAYVAVAIGAGLFMFAKKRKLHDLARSCWVLVCCLSVCLSWKAALPPCGICLGSNRCSPCLPTRSWAFWLV